MDARLSDATASAAARVELLAGPATAAVRSYHPDRPATVGLPDAAIADPGLPVRAEAGQDVACKSLARPWVSEFPDDIPRMLVHVNWLRRVGRRLA